MLEVRPFAGMRYSPEAIGGDLSPVLAPPYDVLSEADKAALLAREERNIVSIDLPHVPPKAAGPAEVYAGAAGRLERWLAEGTLVRDAAPGLYLYHQRFEHEGRKYTRRMFVARVRLQSFDEGSILPHEQTFGGPREDRLALTRATRCQLSPIFGLYSDPSDVVGAAFLATADRASDMTATLDGVENRVWVVADPAVIDKIVSFMAERKIYIADGHHRYGTALQYADELATRAGGSLPDDHPARFVMFVLAAMDDAGCLILPYHRCLVGVELRTVVDAWATGTCACAETEADVVLDDGRGGERTALRFTNRPLLRTLEPSRCGPWYELDYAYLHRYLIDERLAAATGRQVQVRYVKSAEDARRVAREQKGVALLMKATPMAHLRAVSEAGGLMPQKSTFFFPKLATGLVLNPLT